eukprot:TRINITY_DN30292_c0_g1_i1.p1 TRINITY_DN30292_c0_g1~~TRINITY_DN30292_c0_g1_i1.p1  ORF type:complete len:636 (+),score=44.11 TRINITY_DN30292_c0_g1_i1:4516-6423(+)
MPRRARLSVQVYTQSAQRPRGCCILDSRLCSSSATSCLQPRVVPQATSISRADANTSSTRHAPPLPQRRSKQVLRPHSMELADDLHLLSAPLPHQSRSVDTSVAVVYEHQTMPTSLSAAPTISFSLHSARCGRPRCAARFQEVTTCALELRMKLPSLDRAAPAVLLLLIPQSLAMHTSPRAAVKVSTSRLVKALARASLTQGISNPSLRLQKAKCALARPSAWQSSTTETEFNISFVFSVVQLFPPFGKTSRRQTATITLACQLMPNLSVSSTCSLPSLSTSSHSNLEHADLAAAVSSCHDTPWLASRALPRPRCQRLPSMRAACDSSCFGCIRSLPVMSKCSKGNIILTARASSHFGSALSIHTSDTLIAPLDCASLHAEPDVSQSVSVSLAKDSLHFQSSPLSGVALWHFSKPATSGLFQGLASSETCSQHGVLAETCTLLRLTFHAGDDASRIAGLSSSCSLLAVRPHWLGPAHARPRRPQPRCIIQKSRSSSGLGCDCQEKQLLLQSTARNCTATSCASPGCLAVMRNCCSQSRLHTLELAAHLQDRCRKSSSTLSTLPHPDLFMSQLSALSVNLMRGSVRYRQRCRRRRCRQTSTYVRKDEALCLCHRWSPESWKLASVPCIQSFGSGDS